MYLCKKNSTTMLKLLFWGAIGYIVYRYFQMKGQLKGGRHRDFAQHQQQRNQEDPEHMPQCWLDHAQQQPCIA